MRSNVKGVSTTFFTAFVVLCSLTGCTKINDFPMGESHYRIKQVQILDPAAAERNDGIILSLEGNYGREVMQSYRASTVKPATARSMGSITADGSSSN
ncbi:hypothetical protein [Shewanella sp. MBTL60-007]|uniref:hypothetical protein n=1 Tax=Shewanella sp. MBTL60-007 TaxID=2815911 RepID=UPI001BB8412D|nr:hypothetical protein [Shewanella sp. MBTL60-007]GIU27933.1 hypothetical protein TUM3792_36160 [Shewanella sp. MBTL60-007]